MFSKKSASGGGAPAAWTAAIFSFADLPDDIQVQIFFAVEVLVKTSARDLRLFDNRLIEA
jgi:hypothetical protein